jgi:hypothetical protein
LPNILGAIGILVVGWIIAVGARAGAQRLLTMLSVNRRIKESTDQSLAAVPGRCGRGGRTDSRGRQVPVKGREEIDVKELVVTHGFAQP